MNYTEPIQRETRESRYERYLNELERSYKTGKKMRMRSMSPPKGSGVKYGLDELKRRGRI